MQVSKKLVSFISGTNSWKRLSKLGSNGNLVYGLGIGAVVATFVAMVLLLTALILQAQDEKHHSCAGAHDSAKTGLLITVFLLAFAIVGAVIGMNYSKRAIISKIFTSPSNSDSAATYLQTGQPRNGFRP